MDKQTAQIICNLVDLQFEVNQLVKALPSHYRSGKVAHVLFKIVAGIDRVVEGSREGGMDMGRGYDTQPGSEVKSHTPAPPPPGTDSPLHSFWHTLANDEGEGNSGG